MHIKPENLLPYAQKPYIKNAHKTKLYSNNNFPYLDLSSSVWNATLGYDQLSNSFLKEITKMINNNTCFIDIRHFNHTLYDSYEKKLLDFINNKKYNYTSLFYGVTGSEAIEFSLKCIRKISNKKEIISFNNSYHGTNFGSMALSGIDQSMFKYYGWDYNKVKFFNPPNSIEESQIIIEYIELHNNKIAAFFIEPILASSGTRFIKPDYLNNILKSCKKNNIYIIFDEISTCCFKSGLRFCFYHYEIEPDLIILSKSINNGLLPFSSVIFSHELYNKISNMYIDHFSTQDGNLLCITSAAITLDYYIKNESFIKRNVKTLEKIIVKYLSKQPFYFSGKGIMYSIFFNNNYISSFIHDKLMELGLITSKFIYWTDNKEYSGISIICPIIIDVKLFEKAMKLIQKTIVNYDYFA